MMKKLIGAMLGAALVFGAASCDNSLNDKEEPKEGVALEITDGNWWSISLDVSAREGSDIGIVVNASPSPQYPAYGDPDIVAYNAEGSVYYEWDSVGGKFQVSQRTDHPAATDEEGVLKVFVYTQANPVCVWAWLISDNTNLTGGVWPGQPCESATAAVLENITISGISIINADDYDGMVLSLLEAWIPGNNWGYTNPTITIAAGEGTLTFDEPVEITGDTVVIQIVNTDGLDPEILDDEGNVVGFWDNKIWEGGDTASVDNPRDNGTYVLVVDFATTGLSLEEVE